MTKTVSSKFQLMQKVWKMISTEKQHFTQLEIHGNLFFLTDNLGISFSTDGNSLESQIVDGKSFIGNFIRRTLVEFKVKNGKSKATKNVCGNRWKLISLIAT